VLEDFFDHGQIVDARGGSAQRWSPKRVSWVWRGLPMAVGNMVTLEKFNLNGKAASAPHTRFCTA
jgi:hypothetical protein